MPADGRFYLSKKIRSGSETPTGEIKFKGLSAFKTYPTTLRSDEGGKQWVDFGFPVRPGSVVRFSYHPDVSVQPELIMRYEWQKDAGKIVRFYNEEVIDLNLRRSPVRATSVLFTYYDGYNRVAAIPSNDPAKAASALVRISAVKVDLRFEGKELKREASSFINIRALGKSGLGFLLGQGLDLPIPSSKDIRVLRLINFSGVSEGQIIELHVRSGERDRALRFKLYLGSEEGTAILRKLAVFYPADKLVWEGSPDSMLQSGFDLLNFDDDGLYDYDDDNGVKDAVSFTKDPVTLHVERMDPEGVMLVVRP